MRFNNNREDMRKSQRHHLCFINNNNRIIQQQPAMFLNIEIFKRCVSTLKLMQLCFGKTDEEKQQRSKKDFNNINKGIGTTDFSNLLSDTQWSTLQEIHSQQYLLKVDDRVLNSIAKHCPLIRFIRILGPCYYTGAGILDFATNGGSHLVYMEIETPHRGVSLKFVTKLESLKWLHLFNTPTVKLSPLYQKHSSVSSSIIMEENISSSSLLGEELISNGGLDSVKVLLNDRDGKLFIEEACD
ncbi:hypothetical protein BDA99DRAFT_566468 [Phascolomyces articulosus]|uniref:Uncharacterized protein n=1 Tax=Phascolomyces articulosus TaxID=60185 RepID=A0AAD5P6Y4_9FUNG|nr:hypothetical protein BDA99DRAFT_566468 [Phascolomyces articulosus]